MNANKRKLTRILLLLLMCVSPALWAADGLSQLKTFLQDLHTLRADFQQTVQQPGEELAYSSSGVFYLRRPGRLRWEYEDPPTQVIVADGKRIWLHDLELEQVSHRSQKAALRGTPGELLSGMAPLEEHFKLQELGQREGLSWIELRPKEKDSQFVSLRLGLADDQLRRMEMHDSFGQITRFTFHDLQRNPALADELFVFVPPPMVDLIGDL